jgi:hypothetical protein
MINKMHLKLKSLFLFLTLCSVSLFSCNEAEDDFDVRRNNIIGHWKVTQVTREFRADTLYAEGSSVFEITFFSDGTGVRQTFVTSQVEIEWLYQYNPEKIVISTPQQGIFLNSVTFYEITKNEADRQIWEFEVVPPGGIVDVYKNTWKMDKI